MTLYNSIGQGYSSTRQPDPRITACLIEGLELPLGSTIMDLGAGTGNYSNAIAEQGYQVIAIEPSLVMQAQAKPHPYVRWLCGVAESIPLADNSVNGAIVMLALHHFQDIAAGIREIARVVWDGKIVIFAFEQSKIPDFWLTNYFPYFINDTQKTFPATEAIAQMIEDITQKSVEIMPFYLPPDLKDLFAAAGWQKPEIYLDAKVRSGISTFAKIPSDELERGLDRLAQDLNNGVWQENYGYLQQQQMYDAGYRILVAS